MDSVDSPEDFNYDGYLVFNGLYSTEVLNADFDLEEIVSDVLVDFERGEPEEPRSGYNLLNFGDLIQDAHRISPNLKDDLSDVQAIRHQYEEWETRELPSGEEQPTREIRSFDLYWDYPSYMFIRGDKTQSSRASQIVNYKLGEYIRSNKIEFTPDFLLWLFYKETSGTSINENFKISLLSDADIEGEKEDRYGKEVSVDRSTNITKSTNILSGLLRGKDLIRLEGIFSAKNNYIKASLEVGGRVHIKVSEDIAEVNDLERMSLALVFLRELLSTYEEWERKPGEEKVPPPEFLEELYEECKRQGEEPVFSFDDVIEQYRNKRANAGDYIQQAGLGDFNREGNSDGS